MSAVAAQLEAIASRLFADVMAPLVLGGAMRPGHAIGARAALELGSLGNATLDADIESRVRAARVRRARVLVPIDELGPPASVEWTLAAALHDILQATNPSFDTSLRRRAARRILKLAAEAVDRVGSPANVLEALSRHTWLARVLDLARTDSEVSWWIGSQTFRGIEPSRRLQAWPKLRRVSVARSPRTLLELAPLAVERAALVDAVAKLLACSPLTELATCTRVTPPFSWSDATLALVASAPGRTLALRALARLSPTDVDLVLGRATRDALARKPELARSAVVLLADRAIAEAQGHLPAPRRAPVAADAAFARGLGAAAARQLLTSPNSPWPDDAMRLQCLALLEAPTRDALALLPRL
jgi:hypothetical protein